MSSSERISSIRSIRAMGAGLVPSTSTVLALRLALVFSAVFLWVGVYLPYWPVWLEHRGMSPSEVGILLGVAPWTRVIASPLAGRWADRSGRAHRLVQALALALALVLGVGAFWFADSFATLFILVLVMGLIFAPIIPLVDGLTLDAEARGRLSYGPVRLWGSVAFILGSWIGGELLEREGEAFVLWLLIGASALLALAAALLPRRDPSQSPTTPGVPAPSTAAEHTSSSPSPGLTLRSRAFVSFLVIAGLLHLSHAVLYAFGSLHWRAQGLDDGTIGMLWAESVVAEIILFALAPRVGRRLSPRALWLLAGIGGVIRWSMLATTTALPWLVLAQALHGLSFGALHLGAMNHLRLYVRAEIRGHATTLYSAASAGLALGIGLPLAGLLYADIGGAAYWAMAASSGLGMILALVLRTRPRQPTLSRDRCLPRDNPPRTPAGPTR